MAECRGSYSLTCCLLSAQECTSHAAMKREGRLIIVCSRASQDRWMQCLVETFRGSEPRESCFETGKRALRALGELEGAPAVR